MWDRKMGHFLTVAVLAISLLASACTTYKKSDLLDDPDTLRKEIFVDDNYQRVYSHVTEMANECWTVVSYGGGIRIRSELFSDLGYGEISWVADINNKHFLNIKIQSNDNGTLVQSTFWKPILIDAASEFLKQLQEWLAGSSEC